MDRYRYKYNIDSPVIEAVMLTAANVSEVAAWCSGNPVTEIDAVHEERRLVGINFTAWTGDRARVSEGEYLIRDFNGSFRKRTAQHFETQFERVT